MEYSFLNYLDILQQSYFVNAACLLQLMLLGRLMTDGRLNARVKCDLSENLSLKANAQVKYKIFIVLSLLSEIVDAAIISTRMPR